MKCYMTAVVVVALLAASSMCVFGSADECGSQCTASIAESIPHGLNLHTNHTTTDEWISLIQSAKKTIDISQFYWILSGGPPDLGGNEGQRVLDALHTALSDGISMRIVQSAPSQLFPDSDSEQLALAGAQVRNLSMARFSQSGSGVLHTKFFIVDSAHFYVGSANADWRSLTQVKELGIVMRDCACMALDLQQQFDVFFELADMQSAPSAWPAKLQPRFALKTPAQFVLNGQPAQAFISASPPIATPAKRTSDLDAILETIQTGNTIDLEIMDFFPSSLYTNKPIFWPVINDALKTAVWERGVVVRLLVGVWVHTAAQMEPFLRELDAFNTACRAVKYSPKCTGQLQIKLFQTPPDPASPTPYPYTRVNHAKYIVTDQKIYVTTSNWSWDYFFTTGGVTVNLQNEGVRASVASAFERDWNSPYAHDLSSSH